MNRDEISDSSTEEKISFSQAAKGARKYGTVGSNMMPTHMISSYVQHKVQPGETLQGIALRYGTSMELIKRTNKMWNNNALYLRDVLYVPVAPEQNSAESPDASCTVFDKSISNSLSSGSASDDTQADRGERSFDDILNNIDTSIEQAKLVAKTLQENSHVMKSSEFAFSDSPARRRSKSRGPRQSFPDVHARYVASSGDGDTIVILPDFHSRLGSSLERLERKYDEIYEL